MPGPVDNADFACKHGGLLPYRAEFVEEFAVVVSLVFGDGVPFIDTAHSDLLHLESFDWVGP